MITPLGMGRTTIAVYGGSFNPPHVGHAMVAAWVLWSGQADQVWLLPTFRHAFDKALAPFDTRVAWCRAMAGDVGEGIQVSTLERDLPVPSFTIDTLQALQERNPDARIRLLVGADILDQIDAWKDWAGILDRFSPIVAGRAGHPERPDSPTFPGVSSTALRARLAAGRPVTGLVTRSVEALLTPPSGSPA